MSRPYAWQKRGVVVAPSAEVPWMTSHAGPSFAESLPDGRVRLWITGRDAQSVSRIGVAHLDANLKLIEVESTPRFDVGVPGCFDERGVSYPWIVQDTGRLLMYYVGWIAGGLTGFFNNTGLAQSTDGGQTWQRVSRAPILPLSDAEPIGTGSVCVLPTASGWRMYYTSFKGWDVSFEKARPCYHIRIATSSDGVVWQRDGQVAIDFAHPGEYVIGKPVVVHENGLFRMWYAWRGASYRIGYAESADGVSFTRLDDAAGIEGTPDGWDGEMQEYAFELTHQGKRLLFYNGNGFGKTGLGLAVQEA